MGHGSRAGGGNGSSDGARVDRERWKRVRRWRVGDAVAVESRGKMGSGRRRGSGIARDLVVAQRREDQLDRDRAIQAKVVAREHGAHAASAEQAVHAVLPRDGGPDEMREGRGVVHPRGGRIAEVLVRNANRLERPGRGCAGASGTRVGNERRVREGYRPRSDARGVHRGRTERTGSRRNSGPGSSSSGRLLGGRRDGRMDTARPARLEHSNTAASSRSEAAVRRARAGEAEVLVRTRAASNAPGVGATTGWSGW